MGQSQEQKARKAEEKAKMKMKKRWDKFCDAQSAQNKQENTKNNNIKMNSQEKEIKINKNVDKTNRQKDKFKEVKNNKNVFKNDKQNDEPEEVKNNKNLVINDKQNNDPSEDKNIKNLVINSKQKEKKENFFPLFPSEEKFEERKKISNIKEIEANKETNNNIFNNNINFTKNEINNINNKNNLNNNKNVTYDEMANAINNKNNLNYNENERKILENNENNNMNENTNRENNVNKEIKDNLLMKKKIDYENTTIEKVFHITLDEDNQKKYLYLEFYLAKLLSLNQTPTFKLDNLDDIILNIMNEETIKSNLIDYFLECFHRAYEIIEVRFKEVLGPSFSKIHLTIVSYFGQILSSPENFQMHISKKEIIQIINNYYLNANDDEIIFLFKDITLNYEDNIDSISLVINYLFEIIHKENLDNQTFFKGNSIKKNLNLVNKILENCPKVREVILNSVLYNPKDLNGRLIQIFSFLGPYISYSPLNIPLEQARNAFKQFTNDTELKSYINKINKNIEILSKLVNNLNECDNEKTLNYFFNIININFDWSKTIEKFPTTSSFGFLINILFLSLNLFFTECYKNFGDMEKRKNNEYKIKVIKLINTKFCLNDQNIMFSKFSVIYSDKLKDYIELNKTKSESINYNIFTKLFFICHSLMDYVLPNLIKLYREANKVANEAVNTLGFNNPKSREMVNSLRLLNIYVRNEKLIKYILEFNEITSFFLITLNNSKYTHNDEYKYENLNNYRNNIIKEDEYLEFKNDFFKFMDATSNIVISSLPEFCILNIVKSCIFFRYAFPDLYFRDFDLIKNMTDFALIYSSRIDIIHNQHLRSQIFDILLYNFLMEEKEKRNNLIFNSHQKLLKDNFIKDNLILSIMRIYIDAERLGTANQYYEKDIVRYKVFELVNEIYKRNQQILIENILNYANMRSEDAIKMLTLLMSEISGLSDDVIFKLKDIRIFQNLKSDLNKWNSLTDEERKTEEGKFDENDKELKVKCKLLNHSLNFMTIVCSCLNEYFIKEKIANKLACILNHCLREFTKNNSELNIKNKKDYEFNPFFIIESLIKIYSYFSIYEDFVEFIVNDEIYYDYENFQIAVKIKDNLNKVKIDSDTSEKFDDLVFNKLKARKILKKNKNLINYDDAPDEFKDILINTLMEDPVTLPTSNVNLDRKTIEYHLLRQPNDPFNRKP